jgi:hypothetical protein
MTCWLQTIPPGSRGPDLVEEDGGGISVDVS